MKDLGPIVEGAIGETFPTLLSHLYVLVLMLFSLFACLFVIVFFCVLASYMP